MKDYSGVGYAMSSAGTIEELEILIREAHPNWNDNKVEKELDKLLKGATLYNKYNKKPKKAKSVNDFKKPKKAKSVNDFKKPKKAKSANDFEKPKKVKKDK